MRVQKSFSFYYFDIIQIYYKKGTTIHSVDIQLMFTGSI